MSDVACDICHTLGTIEADLNDDAALRAQLGVIDHSIHDDAHIVHHSCYERDPEAKEWWPLEDVTILFINRSDSKCSGCGAGADPRQGSHKRRLGYGTEPGAKGCGNVFTHLSSTYVGPDSALAAQRIQPHLTWLDPDVAQRALLVLKEANNG